MVTRNCQLLLLLASWSIICHSNSAVQADTCAAVPNFLNDKLYCFEADPGELGSQAFVDIIDGQATVVEGDDLINLIVPLKKRVVTDPVVSYTTIVRWNTPLPPEDLIVQERIVAFPRTISKVTDSGSAAESSHLEWKLDANGMATGWESSLTLTGKVPLGAVMDHYHTNTRGLPFGENVHFSWHMTGGLVVDPLNPDLNDDGQLDAVDIDELAAAIRSGIYDVDYDIDGKGTLDEGDLTQFVTRWVDSFMGDADLDGNVAFSDFLALSSNFGDEGGWSNGNFNTDVTIDFGDFLILSANFGQVIAAAVPEPHSFGTIVVGGMLLGAVARTKCKKRDLP